MINYFMFEHISTMLSDKTPELKAEWDKMPYLDGEYLRKNFKQLWIKILVRKSLMN